MISASANGILEQDIIHFNIPDLTENGRTIDLLSQLPDISSNLIVDASTQRGIHFGISSAKIKILTQFCSGKTHYGFALDKVENVEIYGFYIQNVLVDSRDLVEFDNRGISITNCANIRIGAAGKGNVISGFYESISFNAPEAVQIQHYSLDVILQDNFLGIEADGYTLSINGLSTLRLNFIYGKVIIGGKENEGNLIPAGLEVYQLNSYDYPDPESNILTLPADILIANNKIGIDYNATLGYEISQGLAIKTSNPNGKNTILIQENVISSTVYYGLQILNNAREVTIRHNFIGTNKELTRKLPIGGVGIFIYTANHVIIGGENTSDGNFIGYCKPVLVWPFSTVAVKKNSFFCTVDAYPMINLEGSKPVTKCSINTASTTQVKGTATPNSVIELFYSDKCANCSPEKYFASTTADASGNWVYNGNISGAVIASATYNNSTSEFTRTTIDISKAYFVSTCSNTGEILGVVPNTSAAVQWVDIDGNIVGREVELKNVPPGKYKLQVIGIDCPVETGYFEVKKSLEIDSKNVGIRNPSCGKEDGSIGGLVINNYSSSRFKAGWEDEKGILITQAYDLYNAKPGIYTYTIRSEDNSCVASYGPITLVNVAGAIVSEKEVKIIGTSCGKKEGSIVGLQITTEIPPVYNWKNSDGEIVSCSKDLINQPAGDYVLEVTNSGECAVSSSSTFTIPELNTISITDKPTIKPSTCAKKNGAITGLIVDGATAYEWFDSQNKSIAKTATADLLNVGAGDYFLVASNQYCSKITEVYSVPNLQNDTDYGIAVAEISNVKCGLINGAVKVLFKVPVFLYRWVNKQTNTTLNENGSFLQGLEAGTYALYLSDEDGCEKFYADYVVAREPDLSLDESQILVKDDFCGLGMGSISNVNVAGKAPFLYSWTNEGGEVVGTDKNISKLKSGKYLLNITDGVGCQKNYPFSIKENAKPISQPLANDLQVCAPGPAILIVNNPLSEFGYRLYDGLETSIPLDEQKSGRFNITIDKNKSFFISQFTGDCESSKKEIKVTVGFNLFNIPNTISPNGDGINDTWILKNIENYPNVSVKIFNRAGTLIFESLKYQTPFDGKFKGVDLPTGVYYYILKVSDNCSSIAGNLTILR